MIPRSLRARLIVISGAAIVLSLGIATVGLALLFERHVERVAIAELDARSLSLAAMVEPDGAAGPTLGPPPDDPVYERAFSGHYWQVALGDEVRRSRSLWDYSFPEPDPIPPAGTRQVLTLPGPQGEPLLALQTSLRAGREPGSTPLRIIVATDRDELELARRGFLDDLLPYVAALAGLLILSSWIQVSLGLRPLGRIRQRVTDLTLGLRPRIGTDLPTEVVPLAREIDTLLEAGEAELVRARHRAANLAHGLKTPLQALLGDAGRLRDQGRTDIAENVEIVAMSMQRLVDRELARARIQPETLSSEAEPGRIAGQVIEVLRRTPSGAHIAWQVDAEPGLSARIDPQDLTEALGALLENAMRHARNRVTVEVRHKADPAPCVLVSVCDDGPGVVEAEMDRLSERGMRADEARDRHGIGLAIVADIVAAVRGSLTMENAAPGFVVTMRLPRAPRRVT